MHLDPIELEFQNNNHCTEHKRLSATACLVHLKLTKTAIGLERKHKMGRHFSIAVFIDQCCVRLYAHTFVLSNFLNTTDGGQHQVVFRVAVLLMKFKLNAEHNRSFQNALMFTQRGYTQFKIKVSPRGLLAAQQRV